MDFKTGGQKVIERLVEAYGFTTRQALCDHLGVSKSTLATRYMRDLFPAEWVVQCALETGVELKWLTTGEGQQFNNEGGDLTEFPKAKIVEGRLYDTGNCFFDKSVLPSNSGSLKGIKDKEKLFIIDRKFDEIHDGLWLVEIEGKFSVKEIIRIPIKKIKVMGTNPFECNIDDINVFGKVILALTELI